MINCFLFDFYYLIWYTKNDKYNFFKKEEKMLYLIKGKIFMKYETENENELYEELNGLLDAERSEEEQNKMLEAALNEMGEETWQN